MKPSYKKPLLLLAICAFALPHRLTAQAPAIKDFELFRSSAKPKKHPLTAILHEVRSHGDIALAFYSRTQLDKELFRVSIGGYGSKYAPLKEIKLWNYGVVDEVDLNGDGKTDYSWYGGDDSGEEWDLFLSSADGYHGIDIVETIEAAWQRRFHTKSPDLGEVGADYFPSRIIFEYSGAGQMLDITLRENGGTSKPEIVRFKIPESDFKPYVLPH